MRRTNEVTVNSMQLHIFGVSLIVLIFAAFQVTTSEGDYANRSRMTVSIWLNWIVAITVALDATWIWQTTASWWNPITRTIPSSSGQQFALLILCILLVAAATIINICWYIDRSRLRPH